VYFFPAINIIYTILSTTQTVCVECRWQVCIQCIVSCFVGILAATRSLCCARIGQATLPSNRGSDQESLWVGFNALGLIRRFMPLLIFWKYLLTTEVVINL